MIYRVIYVSGIIYNAKTIYYPVSFILHPLSSLLKNKKELGLTSSHYWPG